MLLYCLNFFYFFFNDGCGAGHFYFFYSFFLRFLVILLYIIFKFRLRGTFNIFFVMFYLLYLNFWTIVYKVFCLRRIYYSFLLKNYHNYVLLKFIIITKNYYYTTRVFVNLPIVYKLMTNLLKALRTCNIFSVFDGRQLKIRLLKSYKTKWQREGHGKVNAAAKCNGGNVKDFPYKMYLKNVNKN